MFKLLQTRRSIRSYKEDPVEREKIDILVQSALLSPSSRALKPWEFIVVDDKPILQKLSQAKDHGSSFLQNAPLGIVVLGDSARCDVWVEDCSIAALIIHLTAASLGLGSCWIQIRKRNHDQNQSADAFVRQVLGIPDHLSVEAIIAIGYPQEAKNPHNPPALPQAKVHHNAFTKPY